MLLKMTTEGKCIVNEVLVEWDIIVIIIIIIIIIMVLNFMSIATCCS